jgi:16S rRNA (guanine527-N7)-methyltransferase
MRRADVALHDPYGILQALEDTGLPDVSRETVGRLNVHVELLHKWQKKTNLVANSTLTNVGRRHVADSLQCHCLFPDVSRWLDVGSGAGFPGLVVALAGGDHRRVDLVESNGKKCSFLREVIRHTGARAMVHHARIEDVRIELPQIVSARAVASLDRLFQWTSHWLENGARGLFHKGRGYRAEIDAASIHWSFDCVEHPSVVDADSVLLEITGLERRTASASLVDAAKNM